jgi:hypothetical protein
VLSLFARVHDIRQRITQQETVIELRVPIETFPEAVQEFIGRDVLVVVSNLKIPYGIHEEAPE